ncbi:hypothetical protein B0H14DRAFT_3161592 [Mycena olivaceomarginata]|nr:hypothetical protein B0H14DRAFT_3161592 [Mycena olivaceomarginata]
MPAGPRAEFRRRWELQGLRTMAWMLVQEGQRWCGVQRWVQRAKGGGGAGERVPCRKAVESFPIGLLHIVDYPSAWRTWASKALYVNLAVHPEVHLALNLLPDQFVMFPLPRHTLALRVGSGRAWSPLHVTISNASPGAGAQRRILLLGSDDGLYLRRMTASDGTTHLNRYQRAVYPVSSRPGSAAGLVPQSYNRARLPSRAPASELLSEPCAGRAVEETTTALALDPSDPPSLVSILRNLAVPFDLQPPIPICTRYRQPSAIVYRGMPVEQTCSAGGESVRCFPLLCVAAWSQRSRRAAC